jgi:hypothetical protein
MFDLFGQVFILGSRVLLSLKNKKILPLGLKLSEISFETDVATIIELVCANEATFVKLQIINRK